DNPSQEDEFRGHPHQRVADAVASVILSNEGGRAIGLEGTWGSGKSTVIELVRTRLAKHELSNPTARKSSFFVFDTWAHQSDPLRRVFLEELIRCLEDEAVPREKWSEKFEELQ